MHRTPESVEWPTMAVATAIASILGAAFAAYAHAQPVASAFLFLVAGAWYGSLQHEVVHGHPTPWPVVNLMIGAMPLGLVFPFDEYRRTHLVHHDDGILTDPRLDPESRYVAAPTWNAAGPIGRMLLAVQTTLLGTVTVGVVSTPIRFWAQAVYPSSQHRLRTAVVLRHLAGVAVVLAAVRLLGTPIWFYIATFGYGGLAATLLRSFAEHRAVPTGTQSAVVAAGRALSLLYLNNNLHFTHHLHPGAPWFAIPRLHLQADGDRIAQSGAGFYAGGYKEVVQRFAIRPIGPSVHPANRW